MTTINCIHCGLATHSIGTQMCDRCWELETRISHCPGSVLKRILLLNVSEEFLLSLFDRSVRGDDQPSKTNINKT